MFLVNPSSSFSEFKHPTTKASFKLAGPSSTKASVLAPCCSWSEMLLNKGVHRSGWIGLCLFSHGDTISDMWFFKFSFVYPAMSQQLEGYFPFNIICSVLGNVNFPSSLCYCFCKKWYHECGQLSWTKFDMHFLDAMQCVTGSATIGKTSRSSFLSARKYLTTSTTIATPR